MGQLTLRIADELLERVRNAANQNGRSMNVYVASVLDAATNPELAGDEAQVLRERLAHAGLLVPVGQPRRRPPDDLVARAREAAGIGTPLSEFVTANR